MWLKKLAYHALCLISIVISVERGAQQHHASHQFRSPERDPDTRGPAVAPTDQVHRTEFKPLNKTRRIFGHLPVSKRSLSLIHISEPTRLGMISYAVFCLKKK